MSYIAGECVGDAGEHCIRSSKCTHVLKRVLQVELLLACNARDNLVQFKSNQEGTVYTSFKGRSFQLYKCRMLMP